jgi:hypothetical protein
MTTLTQVIVSPLPPSPPLSPSALADAVLHELAERYDRGPWQERRRRIIIVAAITLACVAAAMIKALSIARRRR